MSDTSSAEMPPDTAREILLAAPGPIGRFRNRLALRLFRLVATEGLRRRRMEDRIDAAYWRGHQRRRRLGFVKCEDVTDGE